jgi:hypothetical protein
LVVSLQQEERGLLWWNLILADRDDIIASLKVRHFKEYLERLAISKQQRERSLLNRNLILADRDDFITSLKVRHFKVPAEVDHQHSAGREESSEIETQSC